MLIGFCVHDASISQFVFAQLQFPALTSRMFPIVGLITPFSFHFSRFVDSCRELVSGSFSIKLKRRNLMNGLYDFILAFAYKVSVSILFVEVCEVLHANGKKFKFVNFDF